MLTITRHTETPSEHIGMQVIAMAADYFTEISLAGTPPSNPLYPIHQAALAIELGIYLQGIGMSDERPVGLITATDTDNPGEVLGFLNFLPLTGIEGACGVTYMAVLQGHRRKGIARAMMTELLASHPHTELSCFVEKVPFYERLGFQLIGLRNTQVRMCTRAESAKGTMQALDVDALLGTPPIQAVLRAQVQKVGQRAFKDADRKFDRHIEQRSRQAKAFVEQHLGIQALS